MGRILHASATTTPAVRRAIQKSRHSLRALARRYGINPKTVAKWKKRTAVGDLRSGPKDPQSTTLLLGEEILIVVFRQRTLLSLDDCLYALQVAIPHLTRSSLHRCLKRHGISRRPEAAGENPVKKKIKPDPIGYFHIIIAEFHTPEDELYIYVAFDVSGKFAFVRLFNETNAAQASAFLSALIHEAPHTIHTVVTDNRIEFSFPPRSAGAPRTQHRSHLFDSCCRENGIEHRLGGIKRPIEYEQTEWPDSPLGEAAINRYQHGSRRQLEIHVSDFINAYNRGRRPQFPRTARILARAAAPLK